jgi:hypothetical protein
VQSLVEEHRDETTEDFQTPDPNIHRPEIGPME